jgi:hypothetical protein
MFDKLGEQLKDKAKSMVDNSLSKMSGTVGGALGGAIGAATGKQDNESPVQASTPAAPPPPPAAPSGGAVCSCGAQLAPGTKFCPSCGAAQPQKTFCSSCGTEMTGAKFCPSCGTPAGGNAAPPPPAAKPAAEKVGNIRKCPSCGTPIGSFVGACPNCGHEFNNAAVASAVKEFTDKLQALLANEPRYGADDGKWMAWSTRGEGLIESFPIPNTREELIEFAILVSGKLKNHDNNFGDKPWLLKWNQIIQKAEFVLADDPATLEKIKAMRKKGLFGKK